MKQTFRTLAVALVGTGLVAFAAAPAICADEFCAMGGMQIKTEVVKAKAIEWGKDRKQTAVAGEDSDNWSVLTLSKADDDIAVLVTAEYVFFGVAGKGGREVDARDAEKAFGKDFKRLVEALQKEMGELKDAGAVKLAGGEIQQLVNAAALGSVEKSGRDWQLTTKDCTGKDLDTSELK